jgi:hypothetical protein
MLTTPLGTIIPISSPLVLLRPLHWSSATISLMFVATAFAEHYHTKSLCWLIVSTQGGSSLRLNGHRQANRWLLSLGGQNSAPAFVVILSSTCGMCRKAQIYTYHDAGEILLHATLVAHGRPLVRRMPRIQILSIKISHKRHTEKSRMFEKFSCPLSTTLMKGCGIRPNKVPSNPNKSKGLI